MLSEDMPLLPGKNDMQGLGAAITYARRFSWSAVCGIASEEDDDGNSTVPAATGASRSASQPKTDPVATPAPPKAENGSEGFDRDKAFKAAKAIERKLKAAGLADEIWDANLLRDFGTVHTSALTDPQLETLVTQLRAAEKQAGL